MGDNEQAPVIIIDAHQYSGRAKGKKFDKFMLASGVVVDIYYVSDSQYFRSYDGTVFKPFYAQVAGKEFRADNPVLIKSAVVDHLKRVVPAELKEVIVVAASSIDGETIRVFNYCFTRTWYGVSGDGTLVTKDRFGKEQRYRGGVNDKMVPFTEERWAHIKEAHDFEEQLDEQMEIFVKKPPAEIAEHLDTRPIFDVEGALAKVDDNPANWLK